MTSEETETVTVIAPWQAELYQLFEGALPADDFKKWRTQFFGELNRVGHDIPFSVDFYASALAPLLVEAKGQEFDADSLNSSDMPVSLLNFDLFSRLCGRVIGIMPDGDKSSVPRRLSESIIECLKRLPSKEAA